jgi:hypothetical protein
LFFSRKKSKKPGFFPAGAFVSPLGFSTTSFFFVKTLSPSPSFDIGLAGSLADFFGCSLVFFFSSILWPRPDLDTGALLGFSAVSVFYVKILLRRPGFDTSVGG